MRISHKFRLIFLAMPRTGSTSVRALLDDVSDVKSVHITQRSTAFPYYNHISAVELRDIFILNGWDWSEYRTFCVVRNPWDRMVSLYHHELAVRHDPRDLKTWKQKIKSKLIREPNFGHFVSRIDTKKRLFARLDDFICDGAGRRLVDTVLPYENLNSELPEFLGRVGLPESLCKIPKLNASNGRRDYRSYYDDESKATVARLYDSEIRRFRYEF